MPREELIKFIEDQKLKLTKEAGGILDGVDLEILDQIEGAIQERFYMIVNIIKDRVE